MNPLTQQLRDERLRKQELDAQAQQNQQITAGLAKLDATTVRAFTALINYMQGATTRTEVVNQLQSINTPDSLKVMSAVNDMHATLKRKDVDLSPLAKSLGAILDQVSQLPKELPKIPEQREEVAITNLDSLESKFDGLESAIQKLADKELPTPHVEYKPADITLQPADVDVDVDLKPLQKGLKDIVSAVKSMVIPEPIATDTSKIEKELKKSNKLLKEITEKPMGGGGGGGGHTTPYQDSDGRPTYVTLNDDGSLPTSSGGNTGAEVSSGNTTSTPLGANATFTGAWEDVTEYDFIEAMLNTSHNSATNGAVVQFSVDGGSTVSKQIANTMLGGYGAFSYSIPCTAFTHIRIIYTNGATAQTNFQLRVAKQKGGNPNIIAPLTAGIDATQSAHLTRSVIAAQKADGTMSNLVTTTDGYLRNAIASVEVDLPIASLTSWGANQQNVGTSSVQIPIIVAAGTRKSIAIKNLSTSSGVVYINDSSAVSSGNGWELAIGESITLEINDDEAIYAIAASGTQRVCWTEVA